MVENYRYGISMRYAALDLNRGGELLASSFKGIHDVQMGYMRNKCSGRAVETDELDKRYHRNMLRTVTFYTYLVEYIEALASVSSRYLLVDICSTERGMGGASRVSNNNININIL